MARDVDFFLLDHVFQPASDRLAEWATCFRVSRICLAAAVFMQMVVLAWNVNVLGSPTQIGMVVLGTLAEFFAAQSVVGQIGRLERQTRPGMMNLARITYRPFRLLWVGFALITGVMWAQSRFGLIEFCSFAVGLCWMLTIYFMCCASTPPRMRARQNVFAFAGAA